MRIRNVISFDGQPDDGLDGIVARILSRTDHHLRDEPPTRGLRGVASPRQTPRERREFISVSMRIDRDRRRVEKTDAIEGISEKARQNMKPTWRLLGKIDGGRVTVKDRGGRYA